MMYLEMTAPAAQTCGRPPSSILRRAGQAIIACWHAYWVRRAQKATIWMLQSLDDRTLHDIGVARCEIEAQVLAPPMCRRSRCRSGAG